MKIQIQEKVILLVLISVFLLWKRAESIRFDLESGHTKCISEDIKSNSMTVGKYQIVNPNDGHPLPESHRITVREPFNAEPRRKDLVSSYITPVELFYKSNHGSIPSVDDLDKYSVSTSGLRGSPIEVFMKDIWKLPKYTVTATLQCAGNRRTVMSKTRPVKGVGWDFVAIGNGNSVNYIDESLLTCYLGSNEFIQKVIYNCSCHFHACFVNVGQYS